MNRVAPTTARSAWPSSGLRSYGCKVSFATNLEVGQTCLSVYSRRIWSVLNPVTGRNAYLTFRACLNAAPRFLQLNSDNSLPRSLLVSSSPPVHPGPETVKPSQANIHTRFASR